MKKILKHAANQSDDLSHPTRMKWWHIFNLKLVGRPPLRWRRSLCVCVCVHNISMREHSWQFDLCIITERAPLSVLS